MASTVKNAFSIFLKDVVNLDSNVTNNARQSRDNLLENIHEFNNDNFFTLCTDYNVHFGSFSRKTKCRELDDIDLMIGISANGAHYSSSDFWNNVRIIPSDTDKIQLECKDDNGYLNSTKLSNKFKKKLENVREYSRSEIKRNGEAIVLNLISKDWSFDIVPCFYTVKEYDGRSYYLIPNGNGNWKKTDPIIDRERVTKINQNHNGKILNLIRLAKRWNKTKKVKTIPSYLLETIILNYCDSTTVLPFFIGESFLNVMNYIYYNIGSYIEDPKNIQGNINNLSSYDINEIKTRISIDYKKIQEALIFEKNNEQKKAITKWREIFGEGFPRYDE